MTSCDGGGGALDNTPIPDRNRGQAPLATTDTGVIVVCRPKIALGGAHIGETQAIAVSGTKPWLRSSTTTKPASYGAPTTALVRNIKIGHGRLPQFLRASVKHHLAHEIGRLTWHTTAQAKDAFSLDHDLMPIGQLHGDDLRKVLPPEKHAIQRRMPAGTPG